MSTYSSTTSHGTQQAVVDLDDFLHRLTCDPVACCRSRIRGDDNTALETKSECSRPVCNLDRAVGIGVIVCRCSKPSRRLYQAVLAWIQVDIMKRDFEHALELQEAWQNAETSWELTDTARHPHLGQDGPLRIGERCILQPECPSYLSCRVESLM